MNPPGQPFGVGAPPAQPQNDQLNLAAIFLMISAVLAILFGLLSVVSALVGANGEWVLNFIQDEALKRQMREAMQQNKTAANSAINMLYPVLVIAANGFILFGALKMKQAQAYSVAFAASIIAAVPCCFTSCCCITSMPAGIFALVVLMKPEVKNIFTS
jgi:hypothetical protein